MSQNKELKVVLVLFGEPIIWVTLNHGDSANLIARIRNSRSQGLRTDKYHILNTSLWHSIN